MSEGKDKILVVVDRLGKYAHFMGVKKTDSTKNGPQNKKYAISIIFKRTNRIQDDDVNHKDK
jgi:hypothetical protein